MSGPWYEEQGPSNLEVRNKMLETFLAPKIPTKLVKIPNIIAIIEEVMNDNIKEYGGWGSYRGYYTFTHSNLIKDITKFWTVYKPELEKYGVEVILLDIFQWNDQKRLLNEDWDGFIWRAKHDPKFRDLAKRFISLLDRSEGIKTFPSWDTYWHYDDKVAQLFLFKNLNIPSPKVSIIFLPCIGKWFSL